MTTDLAFQVAINNLGLGVMASIFLPFVVVFPIHLWRELAPVLERNRYERNLAKMEADTQAFKQELLDRLATRRNARAEKFAKMAELPEYRVSHPDRFTEVVETLGKDGRVTATNSVTRYTTR